MADKNKSEIEKKMRVENFMMQQEYMLRQGYKANIGTISVIKANIYAFVTAGPFALLAAIFYLSRWGELKFEFNFTGYILFVLLLIISIPIHEFLHGFTWHFYCKNKWKSIHFGIMRELLTPYCHCKEPLKYSSYLLGSLMPFFVLGIGITLLGTLFHNDILFVIGIFNILSAGGDTTIVCKSIPYHGGMLLDHPTECGFVAFMKEGN